MRHVIAAVSVTLGTALQLAACSSHVTSVDDDKKLSALTTEEQRRVCDDHARYLTKEVSRDELHKAQCSTQAELAGQLANVAAGGGRPACRQAYDECLRQPAPELRITCENFPARARTCDVTVGEISACRVEQANAFAERASKADKVCDHFDRATTGERTESPKTDACTRVSRACPRILEEEPQHGERTGKAALP